MDIIPVRRQDQDQINQYSILNVKLLESKFDLQDYMKQISNGNDALEEIDLLLDEEELVYHRIGDTFVGMKHPELKATIIKERDQYAVKKRLLEEQVEELKSQISLLKNNLHERFGSSIGLDMNNPNGEDN